jgi:hypothetical protein
MLTLIQICYLLAYRPFENQLLQRLEIMNECFTLLLMYHAMALNLNWVDSDEARDFIGRSIICFIALSICINFGFLFRTIFREFEEKLFRQRGKANKCCLRMFSWCSPKLREATEIRK